MAIDVQLDLMLARRKMRLTELSDRAGIAMTDLSMLKTGKVKAIRFSTLEALCSERDCQPGDLLAFVPGRARNRTRRQNGAGTVRGRPAGRLPSVSRPDMERAH